MQQSWGQVLKAHGTQGQSSGHLTPVSDFGSNPGGLKLYAHVPERLAPSPGLVVVLHGCTQNAEGYDVGAGWSTLADRYGFVVLYPEQQSANNPRTCFNWFQPGDTARGKGEAASIAQMVKHAIKAYGIDPKRVFVTGLSAGGAMTATMLATYPDLFAGGAIVAGLPYQAAENVQEALEAMFQGGSRPASEWGDLVRSASRHRGPWPKVSIWHGGADTTVVPANAAELIKQWTNVHGLPETPSAEERVDGHARQVWRGPDGEVLVESYAVPGMGHGTPLAVGAGEDAVGQAGPFLLDVGISSSYQIAKFWGLTGERLTQPVRETAAPKARPAAVQAAPLEVESRTRPERLERPAGKARTGVDPGAVIAKALTAAGLMKR
jgi:feruloyl esterase